MAKPLAEEATTAGVRGIVAERAASGLADANRAHARLRGPGERANAQLKSWRILRKLRCRP